MGRHGYWNRCWDMRKVSMVMRVETKHSVAQVAIQPTANDLASGVKYEAFSAGH